MSFARRTFARCGTAATGAILTASRCRHRRFLDVRCGNQSLEPRRSTFRTGGRVFFQACANKRFRDIAAFDTAELIDWHVMCLLQSLVSNPVIQKWPPPSCRAQACLLHRTGSGCDGGRYDSSARFTLFQYTGWHLCLRKPPVFTADSHFPISLSPHNPKGQKR